MILLHSINVRLEEKKDTLNAFHSLSLVTLEFSSCQHAAGLWLYPSKNENFNEIQLLRFFKGQIEQILLLLAWTRNRLVYLCLFTPPSGDRALQPDRRDLDWLEQEFSFVTLKRIVASHMAGMGI